MKRVSALAFALFVAFAYAPAGAASETFNAALAGSVFTAALDFIAPRSLDPATVPELARWGLHGLTALDPALTIVEANGQIILQGPAGPLVTQAVPTEATGSAWSEAVVTLSAAAWAASGAVRQAGTEGVIQSFFDEMFNHLDPYSRYVAPVAADADRAQRSGEAGAGLTLTPVRGALLIQAVNAEGGGAAAGLRAGDVLLDVDHKPVRGRPVETVQAWIAGPEGSQVALTVLRRGYRARTVTVERIVTPPETVFAKRMGDVLMLRIAAFAEDTAVRMSDEIAAAMRPVHPVRGLVLDLRGDRGGLLNQAIESAGLLLESGLVATTSGRDPQATHVWEAEGGDLLEGRPVVVLVDGRSASASEILAAALADHGRAVVVGSATFGKGLVQVVSPLPDGGELFVSWSRVLAPLGWPLQGLGVLPQVCTSRGQIALKTQLDALLGGTDSLAAALARTRAARPPVPQAQAVEMRNACPAAIGQKADLATARFLFDHPAAYAAALLPGAMTPAP